MERIAFVIQRYGLEVNGGAELQCRLYAEHMAKYYDVDVLTTKAIDYTTWRDEYEADTEELSGVTVRRFSVESTRDRKSFDILSLKILQLDATLEEEEDWMRRQGPCCPSLIQYIRAHRGDYKVFIFNTYLYYTTYFGLPEVSNKAIMIPTAHDELPIYLNIFRKLFALPAGYFYHTVQEKEFVERRFHTENKLHNNGQGGVGIDLPQDISAERFRRKYGVEDFVVYIGRVDEHKGCKELALYFQEYERRNGRGLQLLYLGKQVCELPQDDSIRSLGFVEEQDKFDALAACRFLILPSQFESLSIVVLEAMAMRRPVLIQGNCEVVKAHCLASNAGLYYHNYFEFEGCMNYLRSHSDLCEQMGKNGEDYVRQYYAWDAIETRLRNMIEQIGTGVTRV